MRQPYDSYAMDILLDRLTLWAFLMETFGFDEGDVASALSFGLRRKVTGDALRAYMNGGPAIDATIGEVGWAFWAAAQEAAMERI